MSRKRNAAPDEVFLSHSSKDARFTARLARVLTAHRVNSFLVVLSPQSVRSRWVKHELIYALQARRYKEHILPILYRTCDTDRLSWTLSAFQWIDFRKDFRQACRQLEDRLQVEGETLEASSLTSKSARRR